MFQELEGWWQNTTPEMQSGIRQVGIVLLALLGGHFFGGLVTRALRARNFDAVLRLPGASPVGPEARHGFTPTLVAGLLVRLTIWGAAVMWLARQHDKIELASTLGLIITRTWALATILVTTLGLASLLAQRVIDCVQGFTKVESAPSRNGPTTSQRGLPGALGVGVYGLVVLLALLVTADMFDWPLTRTSAAALWQLAQHLLTACAALLVGCLGARWARDLATPDGAASPEKRAGQYTALAIVGGTTVLAVAVLFTSTGLIFGLAALALLGALFWLVRDHLPDVSAGLQLHGHKVREVWLGGESWKVDQVGLLSSEVSRADQVCRVHNRKVLEARLHGTPVAAARR
jgi:hypothetical protein